MGELRSNTLEGYADIMTSVKSTFYPFQPRIGKERYARGWSCSIRYDELAVLHSETYRTCKVIPVLMGSEVYVSVLIRGMCQVLCYAELTEVLAHTAALFS
jgi:hypothetical protein